MDTRTPQDSDDDKTQQCPLGTACTLRVINRRQRFCECTPHDSAHRCPQALSFGRTTFCRALWKNDPV
jgi:hypothetical protein